MKPNFFKEPIIGARNTKTFSIFLFFLIAGTFFLSIGISSYFHYKSFLFISLIEINFLPQGILMTFYGSLSIGLFVYLFLTYLWNVGSGYNEFSISERVVRIFRKGFPGKNRKIFLSYDFNNIQKIKVIIKQGLNPRANLFLVLKDKREIPLYPAQFFLNSIKVEEKALFFSELLKIPVEINSI
jgi:hypothetical protein